MSELTAHVDLPPDVSAAAVARRALQTTLSAWGFRDEAWLDAAVLVASELVSNALRHGGGRLALRLHAREGDVTVSVADGSAVVPRRRDDPDSDGGRGLMIVEAVSRCWGVQDHNGGKRVWVLLRPYPATPA